MRVAIADDSVFFREGLQLLLESSGSVVSTSVGTGEDLIEHLTEDDLPDVTILDIRIASYKYG